MNGWQGIASPTTRRNLFPTACRGLAALP